MKILIAILIILLILNLLPNVCNAIRSKILFGNYWQMKERNKRNKERGTKK